MEELKASLAREDCAGVLEALQGLPDVAGAVRDLKGSGVSLVQELCMLGYVDSLEFLADNGVDITAVDGNETPVQVACGHDQLDVLDLLLQRGAQILPDGVLAWHEASPLYIASTHGHVSVIQRLVDNSPGLVKDQDVRSVLFYAGCRGGHVATMKLWITPSMDLNLPLTQVEHMADFVDCEKLTPLYAAASNGHKHVIRFLLESFINLDFTETVCNAYPDIIGEVLHEFFVPMDGTAEEEDIFQLCRGQLQDKRLSVLHPSWLLPYTVTLVDLNVSDNLLTALPDCLPWRFQNLRTFSAMRNKIKCLMPPREDQEEHCPSLEEVNLSYNSLGTVCEELFQIPSLRTLNLSHNRLQFIVRSIHLQPSRSIDLQAEHTLKPTEMAKRNSMMPKTWNVPQLDNLDVSHNSLQMLPGEEMVGCTGLKRLDVSHNHLSSFPLPWDCPLSYMDLSHNQLERFPVNIEQYWCGSLRYLNISHNLLEEINEGLVKLSVLMDLNASSNKLERLPVPELWECSHLHQLDLRHNKLGVQKETTPTKFREKTFPIFPMKFGNKGSHDDPRVGPEFPNILNSCLKELRLADNNLDTVPPTVCNMKALEVLDLSSNPLIKVLPREMGKLKNCGMLKLKGLTLDNVPPGVISGNGKQTRDILDGFLESLRNCKPYRKIKTMVLGMKDKGKTTLVNILADKKGQTTVEQSSIQCREVLLHRRKGSFPLDKAYGFMTDMFSGDKRPDIRLRVWDVVGDEAYTLIQHGLFTPHTLYILVWDFWSIGNELDKIGQLLYNIQACTPHFRVVIVGTFLDKVTLKAGEKETALENLRVKMSRRWATLPELPPVCPVSCATNEGIDALRTVLYEKACGMRLPGRRGGPLMERKIPSTYLQLEARLGDHVRELRAAGRPLCLTQQELSELIEGEKELADLLVPEEYTTVTKFLVESGSLLHFCDQLGALNTLYFLDPAWLCDILTYPLVSSQGRELLKRGNGKIRRSEVKSLYLSDPRFPEAFVDQYIELLERFEIAVAVSQTMLFFPSQLPESAPITSEHKVEHTKRLCRLYRMSECPISFWLRLLSRMMTRVEKLCTSEWYHKPVMTNSIRMLSNRQQSREMNRAGSFRGLQIRDSTKIYCRQLIFVQHAEGSFKVEPICFTGEQNDQRLQKGVLITEIDQTEKFGIIGIIVDEIEDIIQDYYPCLLEPDDRTMQPRLERYAVCSTCFPDLGGTCDADVDHFTMEHCARMMAHDNFIRCPTGIKHGLEKLVPDFLMTELPSRFFFDMTKMELVESKESFLGGGVTGSVFKGKYNNKAIAVKVYRSDIRNKREMFSTADSQSSDSGTATMSTQGSTTAGNTTAGIEVEEDDETEYINFTRDRRALIDLDEAESIKAFRALREMRVEVALTSRLQHPCIIALIGIGFSPKLMMGLELAPLGSLRDLLDRYSAKRPPFNKYRDKDKAFPPLFSKALTFKLAYQIARGLNYLHTSGIIYKDLKSDNILTMSEDLRAPVNLKLSDYGISKYCWSGRSFGLVGTPGYQAPEILDSLAYDEKVDIFSFAMVIYEILTGKRPYMEYENLGQITRAIKTEDKRPRVEDFNVYTQFPYLEEVMQQCWLTQACERPSAAHIVSKRGMQNVHFLTQSSTFKMVDTSTFSTDCVLGTGASGKKPMLWLWDGSGFGRTCSILDLERSCARVFKRNFDGPQVRCMACVGKNVWIGTEHCDIEVYGLEPAGLLIQLTSLHLDAVPVQILAVHNKLDGGTAVYVALDDAKLLQFKSQISRRRGETIGRTVKRIDGFSDPKTVVLRSDTFHCMTLARDGEQLWVSNSGHVDIVDCADFKVVGAKRIILEILFRLISVKQGLEICQMVEVTGRVFCVLQESATILEFEARTYSIVGTLSLREQSMYSKLVFRPVSLTPDDHKAYHGVDLKMRSFSNSSNTSLDSEGSEDENRQGNLPEWSESSSQPPVVPPRVGRESMAEFGPPRPPKRSNTNDMTRRPAIPPRPRQSMVSTLPPSVKTVDEAAAMLDFCKPKLKSSSSQSLPNIAVERSEGIIATSIANVRGSLWVGRSSGDICVVDVSRSGEDNSKQSDISNEPRAGHSSDIHRGMATPRDSHKGMTKTGDASKHGKVVAVLYDINHRKRGEVDKVELLTVGNYVASAHKRIDESGNIVDLASWDAYNAGDAVTVEHYWKDLLNIEKELIEEGSSEWTNIGEF